MAAPTMRTISVAVDPKLLELQAAAIGTVLDSSFGQGLPRSVREPLEGAWNLLHAMIDRAEVQR